MIRIWSHGQDHWRNCSGSGLTIQNQKKCTMKSSCCRVLTAPCASYSKLYVSFHVDDDISCNKTDFICCFIDVLLSVSDYIAIFWQMVTSPPSSTPSSPAKKSKKDSKYLFNDLPLKSKPLIPETLFGSSSQVTAPKALESPIMDESGESQLLVCNNCHICVHASKLRSCIFVCYDCLS